MIYDLSRLDGDPTYAPGMRRTGKYFYWKPAPHLVRQGYSPMNYRLPGQMGDDLHAERAALCRQYTREMLRWAAGAGAPRVAEGTWHWLIARYKTDEFSPFQEVKANTRETYLFSLRKWEAAIGETLVAQTDLVTLKRWHKAMKDNGRSVAYIKRMFTALRIVAGYGVAIRVPGARDVKDTLSEMRVKSSKPRTVAPTEEQIFAVIAEADKAGSSAFALGISLQWWLTLRSVDVRGQWLNDRDGKRWADGLTWDMIDRDLTRLTKTPSKTEASLPDDMVFDLTLLPDVRERLALIPAERRVGPVIKDAAGKPYDKRQWAKLWRRYADAAGLPKDLWMMDTRSGALNHARRLGASPYDLRNQANHASLDTTDRYIRQRTESVNNVIRLRAGTARQQA